MKRREKNTNPDPGLPFPNTNPGPQTAYPETDKTIAQIRQESDYVEHMLRQLADRDDPSTLILAHGLSLIYERIGEYWIWQKAHRGP